MGVLRGSQPRLRDESREKATATTAKPGSDAKLDLMRLRYETGQELFDGDDNQVPIRDSHAQSPASVDYSRLSYADLCEDEYRSSDGLTFPGGG